MENILQEVKELISDGQEELIEDKKIVFDKKTKQSSIKIPKSFALKSRLNENSEFKIIFRPNKEETFEKIKNSKLVIYLEVKNDKEKKVS